MTIEGRFSALLEQRRKVRTRSWTFFDYLHYYYWRATGCLLDGLPGRAPHRNEI